MSKDKIVVGVTDASVSARVVEWAAARAAELANRVELVSVVAGAIGAVAEDRVLGEVIAATRARLKGDAELIAARGVDVTIRVETGSPVEHLVAASGSADVLVIGSDYRGPDATSWRGFHSVRIAAAATCPVVLIPDIDLTDRHGVVVGVDGSEISENALRFAAAEADRWNEPLIAVTVWSPLFSPGNSLLSYPDEYLTNMQAISEEALAIALAGLSTDYPDLVIDRVVESGYPAEVIDRLAASARLCVVGSRGRGAIRRFLLGSISHEVLARPVTATAVVR